MQSFPSPRPRRGLGISRNSAGARGLALNLVIIPPGGHAEPHLHQGYEAAIYFIQGEVLTRYGTALESTVINRTGDFLFIPPDLPHQPINLSPTEAVHALVARNTTVEQESVVPLVVPARGIPG